MFVRAVVAAAAIFSSTLAASADPPKQPTGQWVVHYDDAQCVAERNYGTEEDPLYLVFKQPPLGEAMLVSVMERGAGGSPVQVDGSVQFDGQAAQKVSVLKFASRETTLRVLLMNLPAEHFAPARTADALRIRVRAFDETFALDQVGPLLKVMDSCVADLRKMWNVPDSANVGNVVREDAKGVLRGLFSFQDYPIEALISGDSGTVKAALLVDEAGKVADCSIMQTSGVAVLDAQTCAVLKERAKFTPAVGADGKPAKDAFIQRITWRVR